MNMDIQEALSKLDTFDDALWTGEGAPKIDAVKELLGRSVTRQEIIDVAPHFSRENPIVEENAAEEQDSPQASPETEVQPTSTEVEVQPVASVLEDFASAQPMVAEKFLNFLKTVPTDDLEDLLDLIREQQSQTVAHRKEIDEMEHRLRIEILHTKARIQREIPEMSDAEANQNYIRQQNLIRAQKHAATSALLKGVDLKSLDPRAPIDRAFARKNSRGTKRPGT